MDNKKESEVHIMIDFETLSPYSFQAPVIAIGAYAFQMDTAIPINLEVGDSQSFYSAIKLERQLSASNVSPAFASLDVETLKWWTSDPERVALFGQIMNDPNAKSMAEVMYQFDLWLFNKNPTYCWAHGSSFDNVIFERLCRATGIESRIKYSNLRDTRTLFHMYEEKFSNKVIVQQSKSFIKHHALHDAHHQAKQVKYAWIMLKT